MKTPILRRDLTLLVALAILVRLLAALPDHQPLYMDASYYVDGALNLYEGRGFNDPFIWNYLDDPEGIPHPSHLYWMPLSSVLAYVSFLIFGPTYRSAQVPFVLASSLLPAVAYLVAYDVAHQRRHAVYAGLFGIFSGFYVTRWASTDNFAPFALAGAICLWSLGRGLRDHKVAWFLLAGLNAGLGHLSRADGVLLAGVALFVCAWQVLGDRSRTRVLASGCAVFVAGYLLVMGPWFARNWRVVGRPLATTGAQTMWLTDYDDLFSYAKQLSARAYLDWGAGNIIRSKLEGLWRNLGQVMLVGWMIFLAPCGLVGVWRLRRRVEFRAPWLYLGGLYLAMSLVFTFAGWRGGMLHSMVALLPSMYAAAVDGLDTVIAWVARRRANWRVSQAQEVFGTALVGFAVVLSAVQFAQRVPELSREHPYVEVAVWLDSRVSREARVMVNDPPTFYYFGRRPCIAIPNADLETTLEVMGRYNTQYLILDRNNPSLQGLYAAPQGDSRLVLVETFDDEERMYLFKRADGRSA